MSAPRLTVIGPAPESLKLQKRTERLYDVCNQISDAWDKAGYSGDPLAELATALMGVAIWSRNTRNRQRKKPR